MSITCEYCRKLLKNKYYLKQHQQNTKYCLKLRGENKLSKSFTCKDCGKHLTSLKRFENHQKKCPNFLHNQEIKKYQNIILEKEKELQNIKNSNTENKKITPLQIEDIISEFSQIINENN